MAEAAASPVAKFLEQELEIDDESPWGHIKCPVCLELYSSNPKILPCAHLTCERCLMNIITTNPQPPACPICRYDITDETICNLSSSLSAEQIARALPTDSTIADMVACVKVFDGPHTCEKCGADANSFCVDCFEKFCKKCRRKHSKVTNKIASKAAARMAGASSSSGASAGASQAKAAAAADSDDEDNTATPQTAVCINRNAPYVLPKRHMIEMLADLDPKRIAAGKRQKCRDHPGLNFHDYYCKDHHVSACLFCINEGHQTCKIITAEEEADNSRRALHEQAERLQKQEALLKQEEENLRLKEEESKAMAARTYAEIDAAMDMLQSRIHEEQMRFKQALADAGKLPREQRVEAQTNIIQSFSDKLKDIVSLQEAEAVVQRYERYSRDNIAAIQQRTDQWDTRRRPQQQQRRGHRNQQHHHQHVPQQSRGGGGGRNARGTRGATRQARGDGFSVSSVHREASALSSIVQEVTADLQNIVLSGRSVLEDDSEDEQEPGSREMSASGDASSTAGTSENDTEPQTGAQEEAGSE